MRTTYHILATMALVALLCACDSYLDIKPKGERIPETAADYRSMISHPNIQKITETYPCYLTDFSSVVPSMASITSRITTLLVKMRE